MKLRDDEQWEHRTHNETEEDLDKSFAFGMLVVGAAGILVFSLVYYLGSIY
jgi:hypothetical protein